MFAMNKFILFLFRSARPEGKRITMIPNQLNAKVAEKLLNKWKNSHCFKGTKIYCDDE